MYRFAFILMLLIAGCEQKPASVDQVLALRKMNELVTVEYTISKIIMSNDNKTWYKLGDRKILMSCEASIKAGIDLSGLNSDQVRLDKRTIRLTLPRSRLISLNIRPENVRVAYTERDIFRDDFSSQERDALAVQGEKQIRERIEEMGILSAADAKATAFLSSYLKALGFTHINIRFTSPPSTGTGTL